MDLIGLPVYQDFDFQASGISTLINILGYNTHYLGYYIKMLLNESFIDSATRKGSLYSKAKLSGYVPKGKTCSRIDLKLQISIDLNQYNEPSSKAILIPRGSSFSGTNSNLDQRIFYNTDDIFIKNISRPNNHTAIYLSDTFTIYEGILKEVKFLTDYSLLNQRYIIRDSSVDIDSINILITPISSSTGEMFLKVDNIFDVDEMSPVFYLSTQEEGFYEIIFSNGTFGKKPSDQSTVNVKYISTNGESGNGCKSFRFNQPKIQDIPSENNISINLWSQFSILLDPGSISSGGTEPETVDSLRFTIPHHNRKQNRIVTKDDFKATIISEFRNIDSINVWGGEDNYIKDFGKTYLSIKPKYSNKLTLTAKKEIESNLLSKYCIVGMKPIFIDPEFINTEITVYAKIDTKKTNLSFGQIEKQITDIITEYNNISLNVFSNFLSDVSLMKNIIESNGFIKTCFSKKTINKDQIIIFKSGIENVLLIGNPILNGVKSDSFMYGKNTVYFQDDENGNLYIHKTSDSTKLLLDKFGSIDYDKGIIRYTFPIFAFTIINNLGTSGIINFQMVPRDPDINTFLQNIVRITAINVVLTDA